jgi:hypothetical protein
VAEHAMAISGLPNPKKVQMSKSEAKAVFICVFDCQGIVYQELVPPGQTVNEKMYLQVLEHLRKQVHCLRPELFADKWILHHDNVPSHSVLFIKEFLVEKKLTVVLEHPASSPDLTPCDFYLFSYHEVSSQDITF